MPHNKKSKPKSGRSTRANSTTLSTKSRPTSHKHSHLGLEDTDEDDFERMNNRFNSTTNEIPPVRKTGPRGKSKASGHDGTPPGPAAAAAAPHAHAHKPHPNIPPTHSPPARPGHAVMPGQKAPTHRKHPTMPGEALPPKSTDEDGDDRDRDRNRGFQFGDDYDDFEDEDLLTTDRRRSKSNPEDSKWDKMKEDDYKLPYETKCTRKFKTFNPCSCCCMCKDGICNLRLNCKFIATIEIVFAMISIPVLMNILSILRYMDTKGMFHPSFGLAGVVDFIYSERLRDPNVHHSPSEEEAFQAINNFRDNYAAFSIGIMATGVVSLIAGSVLFICIVTRSVLGCFTNAGLILAYVVFLSGSLALFLSMIHNFTTGYEPFLLDTPIHVHYKTHIIRDLKKFAEKRHMFVIVGSVFYAIVTIFYLYFALCSFSLGVKIIYVTDRELLGAGDKKRRNAPVQYGEAADAI